VNRAIPRTASIADRIAFHESALAALRQEQRAAIIAAIALAVGPGIVFSAGELWERQVLAPELRTAFAEAGIHSRKQLGKKLRQLCGGGLTRVGEDRAGVLWAVE